MSTFATSSSAFFKDIKISHAIFAMPFALSLFVLPEITWSFQQFLWIVFCVFCARSFAMGVNRYLDRDIDALNQRTSKRKLADNLNFINAYKLYILLFGSLFIVSSFCLSTLCGILSIPVLLFLGFYSQLKRFFHGTHFYLGICLGLSPMAVSVAVTGSINVESMLIAGVVAFWVAGFDIFYSLQDRVFDVKHNLKSIPALLGSKKSILVASLSFLISLSLLVCFGIYRESGYVYFLHVLLVACIFIGEIYLVLRSIKGKPLVSLAGIFFYFNMWVGLIFISGLYLDGALR